jgi:hypothetical protein
VNQTAGSGKEYRLYSIRDAIATMEKIPTGSELRGPPEHRHRPENLVSAKPPEPERKQPERRLLQSAETMYDACQRFT